MLGPWEYGLAGTLLILLSLAALEAPFYIGLLFALLGIVFLYICIYKVSKKYNRKDMFRNAIISLLLSAAAIVVAILGLIVSATYAAEKYEDLIESIENLPTDKLVEIITDLIILALPSLVACWFFFIAAAYFWYIVMKEITAITGIDLFEISGLAGIIGVILLPILIGGLIIIVSLIVLAVAFYESYSKYRGEELSEQ